MIKTTRRGLFKLFGGAAAVTGIALTKGSVIDQISTPKPAKYTAPTKGVYYTHTCIDANEMNKEWNEVIAEMYSKRVVKAFKKGMLV